nr:MAG TPA: hypothetical protein [Caudoviricetes sp.]
MKNFIYSKTQVNAIHSVLANRSRFLDDSYNRHLVYKQQSLVLSDTTMILLPRKLTEIMATKNGPLWRDECAFDPSTLFSSNMTAKRKELSVNYKSVVATKTQSICLAPDCKMRTKYLKTAMEVLKAKNIIATGYFDDDKPYMRCITFTNDVGFALVMCERIHSYEK